MFRLGNVSECMVKRSEFRQSHPPATLLELFGRGKISRSVECLFLLKLCQRESTSVKYEDFSKQLSFKVPLKSKWLKASYFLALCILALNTVTRLNNFGDIPFFVCLYFHF